MVDRMNLVSRRWTSTGVEVAVGARSHYPSNLEKLAFRFEAVCDAVNPELWHGEVRLHGHVLLATAQVSNEDTAGRLAENAFEQRVVALFALGGG